MTAVVIALAVAFGQLALPAPRAAAATAKPKAVIIVGPSSRSTSKFLYDGEIMADEAEAAGMDVTRIFHPRATWQRVKEKIQGANYVVYMGHGNGWPSPYAPFQEKTKNGFGLNPRDGASAYDVTYYGASYIRQYIDLAENSVVALVHLCYASGNGEPGMSIPSWDVARQRVDNFAAGFLVAGARTVFAFGWLQKWNLAKALVSSSKTMDEIFQTGGNGYPSAWIGWNDKYFSSERTSGAKLHLDPHKSYGFYRSVAGDLKMTANEWRNAPPADGSGGGGGEDSAVSPDAPAITALAVQGTADSSTTGGGTATLSSSTLPMFHPNGDGLADKLIVSHTVSKAAYLDVKITNSAGTVVRKFSIWSAKGTSTSSWNGKSGNGSYVADGTYSLRYRPRDTSGNVGAARTISVLVLTAASLLAPAPAAIYAVNADGLAQTTELTIKLNKTATISWKILDKSGSAVRVLRSGVKLSAGSHSVSWNGKDADGRYVKDGWYRSVVKTTTALGSYKAERRIYVGAFQVKSSVESPKRGSTVTFTILATEPMAGAPKLDIKQPGLASYTVSTTKVSGRKYKVSLTLKSGGDAGTLVVTARGTNAAGLKVSTTTTLPLR